MNLRITYIVFLGILLVFPACRQNNPITLHDEYPLDQPVEVVFLNEQVDTSATFRKEQTRTSVDVTGLLKRDEQQYPGTILVTGVKSDLEDGRSALAYARILLKDKSDSIEAKGAWGTYVDFRHIDVGTAKLDQTEFDITQVITQIQSLLHVAPVPVGVVHKLGNDGTQPARPMHYLPHHQYAISAQGKRYGRVNQLYLEPFNLTLESPEEISIVGLPPKSIIFRDEDFVLRWNGQQSGMVQVIFSSYDETRGRAHAPLMGFNAYPREGVLRLPSKVLGLIPETANGKYILSLISANRSELMLAGYADRVLVQAASIHNVVVKLR